MSPSSLQVERVLSDMYAHLLKKGQDQDLAMLIRRARTANENKEKAIAAPIKVCVCGEG